MYNKNQASNKHQLMYGKNYNKLPPDTERHRPPKSSNKSCHQSTNLGLFIDNTRKNTCKKFITHPSPVLPNGPIFSDFGPKSVLFGPKGPKMVRFYTQKSDFDQNEEK